MAKFYGTKVKTGKVGGEVYAIRNGETIVRQYQPVVQNPKSAAQEEVRAKMKLMSQLSAVMSPAIAFAREGLISPRNKFVSKNYPLATYANDKAEMVMTGVDLTGGFISLPTVSVVSRTGSDLVIGLTASPMNTIDEVVYVVVDSLSSGTLVLTQLARVNTPGDNSHYETTVQMLPGHTGFVYAYGIKYASSTVRDRYSKLAYQSPAAFIEVIRQVSSSEVYLTVTNSVAVTAS